MTDERIFEEARYKIWMLPERELVEMLQREGQARIVVPQMPPDVRSAEVVCVHHDARCMAFAVRLWRADWPEVLPGMEIEIMNRYDLECREFYRSEDQYGAFYREVEKGR